MENQGNRERISGQSSGHSAESSCHSEQSTGKEGVTHDVVIGESRTISRGRSVTHTDQDGNSITEGETFSTSESTSQGETSDAETK